MSEPWRLPSRVATKSNAQLHKLVDGVALILGEGPRSFPITCTASRRLRNVVLQLQRAAPIGRDDRRNQKSLPSSRRIPP